MSTTKKISFLASALPVFVSCVFAAQVAAQTPTPSPQPRKTVTTATVSRAIIQNKVAPQVVTILHRLNGLKLIGLLAREEDVEAIAQLDQAIQLAGEVHTNIIAGLALDDGKTIAAWLPEIEAEMPPRIMSFVPRAPAPPSPSAAEAHAKGESMPRLPRLSSLPSVPPFNFPEGFGEPANLRVITRDGKRIQGHYVGLDGLTGLSLITLAEGSLPKNSDAKEEAIVVGQQLRVIGPQPATGPETGVRTRMYIRIGETEATVFQVNRSPSGGIARLKIKSTKFSRANIGGIAISDDGQTLGIVDTVEGDTATVVPIALVRKAADRVVARQASVPRPWLGVRGVPIGGASLDKFLGVGWEVERARALAEKRLGILLTSVAPGSPAALAKLRAGDVILSVNNGTIRNAEEFSWLLDEAGPESATLFTVARPGKETSESLEIKLSESPDPFWGLKKFPERPPRAFIPISEGVQAIPLRPRVAAHFGSTGGLLVISVQPSGEAFQAGLRPGDVIESVNGQPLYSGETITLPKKATERSSCIVVRNREKISLTFQYSTNKYSNSPPTPPSP